MVPRLFHLLISGVCVFSIIAHFFAVPVHAATISGLSDRMTSQVVSGSSSHDIRFQTLTGIDAATDTITLSFSSFTLSALVYSDIAISYGPATGLENTTSVAATPGAGIWGASISGTTITLTAPTNAGAGSIPAASFMAIRIGTLGGGINNPTNPNAVNNYAITISGTFGDSGMVRIPIFASENTMGITATIPSRSTPAAPVGGGSAPSGMPDLAITGLRVQRDATYADVFFQTNYGTRCSIRFGLSTSYSLTSSESSGSSHTIRLNGLQETSSYHYELSCTDLYNRVLRLPDAVITGAAALANVADFLAVGGDGFVTLEWQNPPDPRFSAVRIYARTDSHPSRPSDGRLVYQGTDQSFRDTEVTNGTRYFYAVYAVSSGGLASSGALASGLPISSFHTMLTPPVAPTEVTPGTLPIIPPVIRPGTSGISEPVPIPSRGTGGSEVVSTAPRPITPSPARSEPSIPAGIGASAPLSPVTETTTVPTVPSLEPILSIPPIVPLTSVEVSLSPLFFAANNTIELEADASGSVDVFSGRPLLVRVSTLNLPSVPLRGFVMVGTSTYALTLASDQDSWAASFIPPIGHADFLLRMDFTNGMVGRASRRLNGFGPGRVYEAETTPRNNPIAKAVIELQQRQNGSYEKWNGTVWSQPNPQPTARDGAFGFYVLNGSYRLIVKQEGYENFIQEFRVTNHLLNPDLFLKKKPKTVPMIATISQPIAQVAQQVIAISQEVTQAVAQTLEAVRTPETVLISETVIAPVATITAVSAVATAAPAINVMNYLRFLMTQPFLLVSRRKRKKWGLVYNSLTKLPVDLAIVRLLDFATKRVLMTRITDANGRFAITVQPGKYLLDVVKPEYTYPSHLLLREKQDIDYVDLYHGELIEVKEETMVTPNIPVDPVAKVETPKKVLLKKTLRKAQSVFGVSTVILSGVALVIVPSFTMFGLLIFQIGSFFLFRRLAMPLGSRKWGIVYDAISRKTIERAIVRIFDKKFNKLLETQITSKDGSYSFFAGKNVYYVTAERQGYAKYMSPDIDLVAAKEAVIDQPIPLQPKEV